MNIILATQFGGSYLNSRWVDKYIPADPRSGDDVVLEVFANAGLSFGVKA